MMTRTDRRTPRRFPTLAALALAGGLALGGCDGGDDSQTLLTRAANELEILSAGTAAPPDPAYAKRVYATVRTTLAPVLADGLPAEQAAANLLIAETQLGEAADASAAASAATSAMLDRLDNARALFARWRAADARAAAVEGLADDGEIAEASQEIEDSNNTQKLRLADLAELQAQIAQHQTEIEAMAAQITDLRNKSATLRIEADGVSPEDAVTLVRQAQWYSREADSFEINAELIRLQVQRLTPQAQALSVEINNLALQQESLAQVVQRLRTRATQTQAEARAARGHASELAEQLDALLFGGDGLAGYRAGELADQTQAAIAAYSKANATARAAQKEMRSQAQMTTARAQQSIARLHWTHARTLESYQTMLEDLTAIPDYADADDNSAFKGEVEQLKAQIDAALTSANAAFEAARSALDATGARDAEAKASIQAAQQLLSASAQATGDRTVDLSAALDNARRDAPGDPPADPTPSAAGAGTLEAAVDQLIALTAQGKMGQTVALYEFSDPQHKVLFESGARMFDASIRLEIACQDKFGQGLSSIGAGMPGMDLSAMLDQFKSLRAADMRIEQTGDTAIVHMPDPSSPGTTEAVSFVRRGDRWLADGATAMDETERATVQAMQPMISGMAAAFDQIATRVENGEFSTIQEVGVALGQAMGGG